MNHFFSQGVFRAKTLFLPTFVTTVAIATSLLIHQAPAAAQVLDGSMNEQIVLVPTKSGTTSAGLETTIFKPPGAGPFPLVVMNHGKALGNPQMQPRDRFLALSSEFVKRGYAVVIPMRKGFSKSTGTYVNAGCNMATNGQAQADDLQSTLEYLQKQSWVDRDRIVVAGQSYGGLTALAFGARNFPGVKGVINFAGGLKVHGGDCQWQASLVQAFGEFGAKTAVPSLWFYGANDGHFSPELAARMHGAYVQAGGRAKLVAYDRYKDDAHGMSGSWGGVKIWWPETERFLKEIGMPTAGMFVVNDDRKTMKTDFAALDNVDAIPFLEEKGREQYRVFLNKPLPRAFAVSSTGVWSWVEDGDDPKTQVLANCQKTSRQPCKLYAVDDYVVWTGK